MTAAMSWAVLSCDELMLADLDALVDEITSWRPESQEIWYRLPEVRPRWQPSRCSIGDGSGTVSG